MTKRTNKLIYVQKSEPYYNQKRRSLFSPTVLISYFTKKQMFREICFERNKQNINLKCNKLTLL